MKVKSVLFFFSGPANPQKSGIARVYSILASSFSKYGIKTGSLASDTGCAVYDYSYRIGERSLMEIIADQNVDVLICGNPIGWLIEYCQEVKGRVKIIGHYHSSPKLESSFLSIDKNWLNRIQKHRFVQGIVRIVKWHRNYGYFLKAMECVDKMVLLSESFFKEWKAQCNVGAEKLVAIANPVETNNAALIKDKERIVLYVGRITEQQKRISSLLNIWELLSKRTGCMESWKLVVCGDGPDLERFKSSAAKRKLERIEFKGFVDPTPYYEKASILFLTSNYEGFGNVIVEAMSRGCVPIVYDSYSSAKDIITSGKDGILVTPFDDRRFACMAATLANNSICLKNMSESAIHNSKKYCPAIIAEKWFRLFEEL